VSTDLARWRLPRRGVRKLRCTLLAGTHFICSASGIHAYRFKDGASSAIPKTSLNSRLRKGAIAGDLVRLTEGRGLRPGSDLPGVGSQKPVNRIPQRPLVRIRIKIKRRESENGTFRTWLLQLMMSVHWVKADIAVASVDLISIRPLKPRVGGGQISAGYRLWTGGPGSYAKNRNSIQKAH
jgi:hypothetical protein